jgi:phage tail sheath protein FI
VIYGQKTLQVAKTAINRINVRRLLIALRRFITDTCKGFVFEQNTSATRIKLKNILNPYMESVKNKQGLYAYRVIVDDTNNTGDVIDRNELQVMIKIAPTRTIEFVLLTFVISPTGVSF